MWAVVRAIIRRVDSETDKLLGRQSGRNVAASGTPLVRNIYKELTTAGDLNGKKFCTYWKQRYTVFTIWGSKFPQNGLDIFYPAA